MGDERSDEERESRPHHFTFIAIFCTLRPASVSIIPTIFETVALAVVTTVSASLSEP